MALAAADAGRAGRHWRACPGGRTAKPIKQIKLTDEQVTNFIAAQPDLAAIAGKLQEAGEKPDPALQAELEGIAKKHGFASFSRARRRRRQHLDRAWPGSIRKTGDSPIRSSAEEGAATTSRPTPPSRTSDKKQLIDELTEAIKTTPPLEHKENVDIVKAHRAEIEKALQ